MREETSYSGHQQKLIVCIICIIAVIELAVCAKDQSIASSGRPYFMAFAVFMTAFGGGFLVRWSITWLIALYNIFVWRLKITLPCCCRRKDIENGENGAVQVSSPCLPSVTSGILLLHRIFQAKMPDSSFMHIDAQGAQVPGAIIIDGMVFDSLDFATRANLYHVLHICWGPGCLLWRLWLLQFGWSKYASPSGRLATFLEFGNIDSPIYSRLRHFFSTIYSRMQVKPYMQPIVVSVPICHSDDTESDRTARKQLEEAIYTVLFDMNVPAVCAINQAVLALFAAKRTSGIVVNIGFNHTSVVPILHGRVMHRVVVEVTGMGALKLTRFLREKMQQNNLDFDSLYTVRALKENLCYVALDYEAELEKDTEASYLVAAEEWFTLSKERFQTGEILFQPCIAGMRTMGLHQAVALCMDHCQAFELSGDDSWFKTVILAGGSACLPGLAERLEKELLQSLPRSISKGIHVIPPPYGADSAWYGAKHIANLSSFPGSWCVTKKQYRQMVNFSGNPGWGKDTLQ